MSLTRGMFNQNHHEIPPHTSQNGYNQKFSSRWMTADAGEDVEKEEHSSLAGVIASWYNHSGNQSGSSSENYAPIYQSFVCFYGISQFLCLLFLWLIWFNFLCLFGLDPLLYLWVLIFCLLFDPFHMWSLLWVFWLGSWVFPVPSSFQLEFSSVLLSPCWIPFANHRLYLPFPSAPCLGVGWLLLMLLYFGITWAFILLKFFLLSFIKMFFGGAKGNL